MFNKMLMIAISSAAIAIIISIIFFSNWLINKIFDKKGEEDGKK